jgi:hypothetical protein
VGLMLPPKVVGPEERRLTRLYRALGPADRHTLLAFAEFLAHEGARAVDHAPEAAPEHEPRPEGETVIAAIRRLGRTYSMLDRDTLLHETSALMSAHVLHGREAAEVIDELERLFERRYREHRDRRGGKSPPAETEGPA